MLASLPQLKVLQLKCRSLKSSLAGLELLVKLLSPNVISLQGPLLSASDRFDFHDIFTFHVDSRSIRGGGLVTLISKYLAPTATVNADNMTDWWVSLISN